jgi:hypothetical protein
MQLIYCFQQLLTLFSSQIEIEISTTNLRIFQYLLRQLDNPPLITFCEQVSLLNKSIYFELNSIYFKKLPKSLQNFNIIINGPQIHRNSSHTRCPPKKIHPAHQLNANLKEISFNSDEFDSILKELFKILKGKTVNFNQFSINDFRDCFLLIDFPFNFLHFFQKLLKKQFHFFF